MSDLNQLIIEFKFEKNFKDQDFYVSKSNEHVYKMINIWPKWEKKFLNIYGKKFSGKTHLINIFKKKNTAFKIDARKLNNNILDELKLNQNIIIENLNDNHDIKNHWDIDKEYLNS